MGISISDMIALARAGYTPSQVKELMTMETSQDVKPEPEPEAKAEEPQAAAAPIDEAKTASAESKQATENASPEKAEDPVDYKALYEQTKADLDKAQKANVSQNAGDVQKPEDAYKHLTETISTYL